MCAAVNVEHKLANGGLRYLAKEIFKQSTEDIAWILTVYSKM